MKIYNEDYCAACYFRTKAEYPNKKCLLQLTERCNLHCKHCFVSADNCGNEMDYNIIEKKILPQLIENHVTKVTLTGGEPFVYAKLFEVVKLFCENDISVGICTNATLITEEFLKKVCRYAIHFNVSLDGFSNGSHGKFRGFKNPKIYDKIIYNIKMIAKYNLLNGILVTPNNYSSISEYVQICKFAKECKAKYVLMNPLSQFGRGEEAVSLGFEKDNMRKLQQETEIFNDNDMEVVYIRFPNDKKKPLSECTAGDIMYIFTNGDIAFCPYMVFAARDDSSIYEDNKFILGNIYDDDFSWKKSMEEYHFPINLENSCLNCTVKDCKKGCYASKIACGNKLEDVDELCPNLS